MREIPDESKPAVSNGAESLTAAAAPEHTTPRPLTSQEARIHLRLGKDAFASLILAFPYYCRPPGTKRKKLFFPADLKALEDAMRQQVPDGNQNSRRAGVAPPNERAVYRRLAKLTSRKSTRGRQRGSDVAAIG